jgi:NAD(P)H-flavin reductase
MSAVKPTDPYLPKPVTIRKISIENEARDIKTFELVFCDKEDQANFHFNCGQFAILSVLGAGESPIGIASSPLDDGYLNFTVKRYPTGVVTTALHNLEEGSQIGIRGPYGNYYPLEELEGKNALIVGGGFAFTTLRSTIRYMHINIHITVDKGDETWKGREGFVPTVLKEVSPSSKNAVCLVCGPPIMLKFTMVPLLDLGFSPETIVTSLERRMSCGIGKCGRCNISSKYVCKDGPVFTYKEIRELPEPIF